MAIVPPGWVEMDHPQTTGTQVVTQEAYDQVWAAKGWVIINSGTPETTAPALAGMFAIKRIALAADAASIDFTDIPSDYECLVIIGMLRSKAATIFDSVVTTFNGDAVDANYALQYRQTANTTTTGVQNIGGAGSRAPILSTGDTSGTGDYAATRLEIPNYTSGFFTKHMNIQQGVALSRASANLYDRTATLHWRKSPAEAINRITFTMITSPFLITAGSYLSLYGIKSGAFV